MICVRNFDFDDAPESLVSGWAQTCSPPQFRDSERLTDNGSCFHDCQKFSLTDGRSAPIYGLWMARFFKTRNPALRPCSQFISVGENGRMGCVMEAEGAV